MSNWGVDVVFIHGLMGGVFYTWRQADPHNEREGVEEQVSGEGYSYCWPRDWLAEDSQHVRVLGCDFDSYLSQWGGNCPSQSFKQSLADRSSDMMRKLRQAGVGNRPVIFVGHSMGGLIVKQMLAASAESADPELQQLSNNTKGVVFYSTPHEGSEIANMNSIFKYFFFPSVEVQVSFCRYKQCSSAQFAGIGDEQSSVDFIESVIQGVCGEEEDEGCEFR